MAIKEYRVAQADTRPIRRRPLSMVRNLVPSQKDSKAGDNAPMRTKDQPAITAQGRSPRYDADSIMGVISSLRSPGEANTAYDPSKPVGGENVPYKPTTGIGGVLSRFFGNQANEMNVAAQEQQAAEKMAEEATAKERQAKKEDLAEEIALRTKEPARQFDVEQKRLADKALRDEIKGYEDEAVRLAREGQEDVLRDADMVRKEALAAEEGKRRDRELDIRESAIKPPRYSPIGNTGMFQTPEGELAVFEPETMRISDKMPGRAARFRMLTGAGSKAPGRSMGDVEVDRVTSKPLGASTPSPTTTTPEVPNTALFPTMGRAIGESTTEATTAVTDPLRAVGTDIYKALFSSSAQQDPEVLKRIKEREARRASTQPRFDVPLGY
jgi:hypothetical protein